MSVRILIGDCREKLLDLPDASVNCCVTSPPYFGLRDYGAEGQMGLEPTPDEFVAGMVAVFREVKRVLRDDGTLFLNIGDSYSAGAVLSQSYRLREDLTDEQRTAAVVAMFGVRFDEHLEAGEGTLPQVLSSEVHCETVRGQSALASGRVQGGLPAEQGEGSGANAGAAPSAEMGSSGSTGRQVRLLRGVDGGVPDGRSHKRRRRGPSEATDRQGAGQLDQDLQGHSEARISQGPVPRSLLQLQLRDRLVGILSAQSYSDDQIPAAAKTYFVKRADLKPKDLIGIPWMLAFALRADGWFLRQDCIWSKPNPMPESVRDRCTKAHEYLFLLSKGPRYYYDAEAIAEETVYQPSDGEPNSFRGSTFDNGKTAVHQLGRASDKPRRSSRTKHDFADDRKRNGADGTAASFRAIRETRNKRSVWEVATQPFSEAHFATYPPALIEPCILAGCPEGGTVLDPFGGAGTTGLVADRLGRDAILIELNPEYAAIAERRLNADAPLFAEVKAA